MVSTRKVDDLLEALVADTGSSKSEVSRICADLDAEVSAFSDRSLAEQPFPYAFLDATYCKARVNCRVVSQAVVIATGVAADGHREVLGFAIGDIEDGAFWTALLRLLKVRGPSCWARPGSCEPHGDSFGRLSRCLNTAHPIVCVRGPTSTDCTWRLESWSLPAGGG